MNLGLAILLSGLGGFVALSYELVWFRVVNYASSETAAAFSLLLGSYLLGLAIGSLAAQLLADRDIPGLQVVGGIAFVSAMVGFFSCPMIAFFLSLGGGVLERALHGCGRIGVSGDPISVAGALRDRSR